MEIVRWFASAKHVVGKLTATGLPVTRLLRAVRHGSWPLRTAGSSEPVSNDPQTERTDVAPRVVCSFGA